MSDPYLVPRTDVLRNKFGILNADDLDRLIDDIATIEAAYLFNEGPPARPTLASWQAVHRAMFGAAFDWAGDFRTIHIRKLDENGQPSGYFAPPDRIEADGRKAIRHLEATLRRAATDGLAQIADNLAEVYGQLNFLHPFREGNGRSPADEHNMAASRAMNNDPSLIREHFKAIAKKSDRPGLRLQRGT